MVFIDPFFKRALTATDAPGLLVRGGVARLREILDASNDAIDEIERAADVEVSVLTQGAPPVVIVRPRVGRSRGVLFVIHGGGLVAGSPFFRLAELCRHVRGLSLTVVLPLYRLAPEHPYPAAIDDVERVWSALDRISAAAGPRIVWGGSAGGMLAAGLALRVGRNELTPVNGLMLLQPMLDDRPSSPEDPALHGRGLWDHESNRLGWEYYLAGANPPTADMVPARATTLSALAQLYIEVAQADVLRSEALAFAERASRDGVSTELHLWPGAIHGFEGAPESVISRAAWASRLAYLERRIEGGG